MLTIPSQTSDRTADVNLKMWAVEPIVRSLAPIIERFANGTDLVCEGFREQVADRLAELPALRDPTELPPGPDLAPGRYLAFQAGLHFCIARQAVGATFSP